MSVRKKEVRGAAAASAAHSAAKRKSAAVELSADNESRIRSALAELGIAAAASSEATSGRQLDAEEVAALYHSLMMEGFQQQHVQQALQALAGSKMTQEAALDWLCLHVDPAELPRRFAGNARSRASAVGIKVLAKAKKRDPSEQPEAADVFELPTVPAAKAGPKAATRDVEKEKQSQREWILQYMQQEDSSDDEDEKADDVVEDWEVWGDPREIERRKADRKRANLPIEQRRQQLAEEWVQAKTEASKAKAAADKPRQKVAGGVIRDLKLEMKTIGLTEEAAESLAAPPENRNGQADAAWHDEGSWPLLGAPADDASPTEAIVDNPSPLQHSAGPEAVLGMNRVVENEANALEEAEHGAEEDSREMGLISSDNREGGGQAAGTAPGVSNGRPPASTAEMPLTSEDTQPPPEDEADNFEGSMSLFDEEVKQEWEANTNPTKPPRPSLQPWGFVEKWGAKKKGLKARPVEHAVEVKAPKALLQQLCQKELRGPPRFERSSLGGHRLPLASMRYSVTVLTPPQRGGGKKKLAPKQRTFALREDEDGWDNIQDAQNAAATLALFQLSSDKSVFHSLPPVFQELWLAWDAQGSHSAESQVDEADKLTFVESLVAQGAAAVPDPTVKAPLPLQTEVPSSSSSATPSPATQPQMPSRVTLELGRQLQARLARFRASTEGQQWQQQRSKLPVMGIRDDLLAALASNDVAVVSGDTGCGKTTQVPQYILDADIEAGRGGSCSIICTQPRRIAAISVAERVCQEREDSPPGTPGSLVGYHVRLDAAATRDTRLLFCTTGILLRRLASDPLLASTSHIVVDEVHERTVQGDFLMALLKDIVAKRRQQGNPLKVVLMSATLDSALFARYFHACPALAAGGRTFPVTHCFLEDVYEMTGYRLDTEGPAALRQHSDAVKRKALLKATGSRQGLVQAGWGDEEADAVILNSHYDAELYTAYSSTTRKNLARVDENYIDFELLEELVQHLASQADEGAILVFLPGMGEINAMYERLTSLREHREGKQWVLPLHSSVSPQEQRRAFEVPPCGVRKIVLATNIAETSLTISDVSFVVDSGKLKERRYDVSRGMSLLVEDWVSRANALQRKGRAGRVRAGQCFGLYTRHRFESRMRPFQAPEIVRIPLEELVLQIQLLGLGPAASFLDKVIEPPPARSIAAAISQLQSVGALTPTEQLTPLGHHLAQLPVDARVGKLLLLAASLACLSPALTIAACLSYRPPFSAPFDQQDAAQRIKLALAAAGSGNVASGQQSDHLLMAAAYKGWGGKREGAAYARKHMLSQQTLEMLADMRWQFGSMLADSKFVAAPSSRRGAGAKQQAWLDDPLQPWNKQAGQAPLVKAVLCAALFPNVAAMDDSGGKSARPAWNDGTGEVFIHPSSIIHGLNAQQFQRPYLTFLEKVKTSRTFLRDCTITSPMALLLFGGALEVVHQEGYVLIDGWIRVRAAAPTAVLVKSLRQALDALLEKKIAKPELDLSATGGNLVSTLVALLDQERWDQ